MHSIHKAHLFLNLNNLLKLQVLNLCVLNFFFNKKTLYYAICHEKTLYNTIYFKEKNHFSKIF